MDPLIGVLIDGRYRVTGRLARGGMATVYIAYDHRMEREVAVKGMHPHLADSADFLQRFQREARSAARITHPGVVSVFDQGIINGQGYLAMDLIHGLNLRQMLQANGALSLGRALHFTEQVLHALHAAHSVGVIHRDIKPENVLVDGSDRALLSDFGLARAATETSNSSTGSVLGTVAYVAPEVVTRGFIDARSDIYSTGIVLFELITGEVPWAGETPLQMAMHHASDSIPLPSSIQPWIPSEVDDVVAALTSLDPQFRPVDASQAASMVTQCISRLPHNLLDQRSPIAGVGLSKDVPNSEAQDAEGEDTPAPGNATTVMETVTPTSTLPTTASAAFTHTTNSLSSSAGVSAAAQAGTDLVTTSHKVPTDAQETNTPTRPAHAKKDVDPKRRKRLRKILIGFLFSLLLLGGGGYGGYVWWNELGPGSYYPVPAVAGQSEDEAQSALNALGVTIEREESFHDDIPAGSIISTSPDGGQQVHKTGKVTLLVSKGVDMRGVPDVRGKTAEEASTALVEAGLALGSATEEWSESVEKGRIIDQSTPAGELLKHERPKYFWAVPRCCRRSRSSCQPVDHMGRSSFGDRS